MPYLSTSGFSRPILIPEAEGLGLTIPENDFCIPDIPLGKSDITLEYQINVGYQINVALGNLVKINKRRLSNKRRLGNFCQNQ